VEDVFDRLIKERAAQREFAVCIVTATKGSVPRKKGAKMMVYPDGKIFGTIGGGRVEKRVIEDALKVLQNREPVLIHYDLLKDLGMSCGGNVDIYIEPVMKKNKLYIFGAGHTGVAFARRAIDFEFNITMIDDRQEYIDEADAAGVTKICGDFNAIMPGLEFDNQTYITIMTYTHNIDRQILAYCIKKDFAYLGMMGSLRKVELTKKMFLDENFASQEELSRVDMPMGIEIGAEGPDEIAISILAKIIAVKHKC